MADPYWRYGGASSADRAVIPPASFPGYLPSATPALSVHHSWASSDLHGSSSDFLQKDVLPLRAGAYGVDDIMGVGVRPGSGLGGYMSGTNIRSYTPSVEDPSLLAPRDVSLGIGSALPGALNERPASFGNIDDHPAAPKKESNVLFVDGLPNDCTRREVGHLFRPFIGFREIRVVHKEPRRVGDKAMVLCFVEFTDAKCALTALEALQGYKFDNKKPDSSVLSIHFAHFPFRLPSAREELLFEGAR